MTMTMTMTTTRSCDRYYVSAHWKAGEGAANQMTWVRIVHYTEERHHGDPRLGWTACAGTATTLDLTHGEYRRAVEATRREIGMQKGEAAYRAFAGHLLALKVTRRETPAEL